MVSLLPEVPVSVAVSVWADKAFWQSSSGDPVLWFVSVSDVGAGGWQW